MPNSLYIMPLVFGGKPQKTMLQCSNAIVITGFCEALDSFVVQPRGALAQLGERNTGSVEVSGSIPLGSTNRIEKRRGQCSRRFCVRVSFEVHVIWPPFG